MIKDLKIKPAGGGKANPKGKGNGKKPKATAKAKNGPKRNPKGDSTKGGSKKGNDNKKGKPQSSQTALPEEAPSAETQPKRKRRAKKA